MKKPNHITSKGLLIFTIIAALLLPGRILAKTTEERVETFDLNRDGHVLVSNIAGNITITTWPQDQVKMTATKIARSEKELELVFIDIDHSDKMLRIETKYRNKRNYSGASITYELIIPDKASITIETISGDVDASGLGGEIEIETISGEVTINKADSNIDSSVISGDIKISDVIGDADISSISGDILITNLTGSLSISSVSGDVILENIAKAEKIKADSVSGNIHFSGEMHPTGYYKLNCHSGDIVLRINKNADFNIQSSTFSGKIKSDFELDTTDNKTSKEISGSVGDGGTEIRLVTFSGKIILSKAE